MLLPRLRWPSRRTLAITVAVVVAAAVLGGGAWWWSRTQARRADAAYASALAHVQETVGPQAALAARAAAIRDLEGVLAQYPSARLAGPAAYELANMRYAARDWARARAAYEVALARAESPTVRALARLGIGYTWEAERNYPKALDTYQGGLAALKPGDFQYEELLLDLGRVQELAGRKADAIATYRRALRELPQGLRTADARSRLATLGAGP